MNKNKLRDIQQQEQLIAKETNVDEIRRILGKDKDGVEWGVIAFRDNNDLYIFHGDKRKKVL